MHILVMQTCVKFHFLEGGIVPLSAQGGDKALVPPLPRLRPWQVSNCHHTKPIFRAVLGLDLVKPLITSAMLSPVLVCTEKHSPIFLSFVVDWSKPHVMIKNNRTLIIIKHTFKSKRQGKIWGAFGFMPLSTLLPFYSTKTLKFKFPGAAVGHPVLPRGKEVTYDTMEIQNH